MNKNLKKMFLEPSGWTRSALEQSPVRADGTPLPWFTYGAIEFLERIVRSTDRVFEYGAGFSTLWWQNKAAEINSVEHDVAWYKTLKARLGANAFLAAKPIDHLASSAESDSVALFFKEKRRTEWDYDEQRIIRRGLCDERFVSYATHIQSIEGDFDFIVVDGMARRLCTWLAISKLQKDGFIILDNSNRSDYDLAFEVLVKAGFHQIPFWGLVPGADFMTCTSIFTRTLDRLPGSGFQGNSFKLPEY